MTPALSNIATFLGIVVGVAAILAFFSTRPGEAIGRYLPTPFWVYFLATVAGTVNLLPRVSPVYTALTDFVLPAAVFLLLVGAPVAELVRLGARATLAWAIATGTIMVAGFASFALLFRWMPPDSWKGAGALMGTWIGGSANMLAVKEILGMSDSMLAPLVIVDTFLSYGWLALLLAGVAYQKRFDRGAREASTGALEINSNRRLTPVRIAGALLAAAAASGLFVVSGRAIAASTGVLTRSAWVLLIASAGTVLFALTPLRRLQSAGASEVGAFLLYMVLVTIGAKADLAAVRAAPIYFAFGAVWLTAHGVMLLLLGRAARLPLFLLTTASQADVGGAVSAPVVASAYRPGSAHIGVLMAIAGAVTGTYLGWASGLVCKFIEKALR